MIAISEKILCLVHKMVGKIGNLFNHAKGAQRSLFVLYGAFRETQRQNESPYLLPDIGIARTQQLLNLIRQIS